jgi:hypothetical protein
MKTVFQDFAFDNHFSIAFCCRHFSYMLGISDNDVGHDDDYSSMTY